MDLVRSWARWMSTALGASLVIPATVMIVAAGVAIGGGGLASLGALGQLVGGPEGRLGATTGLGPGEDTLAADPSAVIAAVRSDSGSPSGGGTSGGGGGGGGTGGLPDGTGDGGGGTPGGGGGGGGGSPGGDRPDGGGGGGSTPEPEPEPDPSPLPLEPVQEGTEEIVQQLPEPVGPLSGDVIDQVVQLGEDVLGRPGGDGLFGLLDPPQGR